MNKLLIFILAMLLLQTGCGKKKEMSEIKANAARLKLTPPLEMKYSLGGYGDRMSKPATGINDDIWVKALVLSDGHKKFALITMDILAFPPNVKPAIIERLADEHWNAENIMLLPSHSHASIDMSAINDRNTLKNPYIGIYQPDLLEFVLEKTVKVIQAADQDLQPVSVGTKKREIEGMNRNRRNENAVDRDLTVTRIDRITGAPLAVLVNWTAHPTFMSDEDMLVSAGWPGYLQQNLEQQIGGDVICMYYNGAQGDQSVMAKRDGTHYEQAEKYGRIIARNAHEVFKEIRPVERTAFNYAFKLTELPEPRMHPMYLETGGEEYGMDEKTSNHILTAMCPQRCMIHALRLGNWMIAGAPGELTAVLGLEIKNDLLNRGIANPTIGGMANEWLSYITDQEQYNAGGYETSMSFYGPELGSVVTAAMLEVSRSLTDQDKQ